MRASSPNRPALGFSQLRNQSSPPLPRPQNASLMASPPRFQSAIISGSPSRTQNAFMPRIGGTATEGLRREKEALQAEIENVKRMCHGLQVQYENMKMEHQATSEDYDKLRQEIQVLRRDQAELGWDHGHLKLENQGFKKMKGEILEEDATQARAYENMTKEVAQLKQKLKELDLIERRRKYDAQVSDLEATLRHAQSRVDSMYSNPHSRIGHETLLDVDRSRTGYIDRPLTTLLPAGLLSPKGLGDGSVRVDAFLSPRVQREPLINPTRISPIKNPLHERKQEVVVAKEVVYASPPKAGTLSRVLASPSVHYDENRLSIIQPQVIHPVTVNQVIQPQHVPNIPISQVIHSGPVNHVIQPQVVPMGHVIQPGVVDHGHIIMNNPVEIVEAPIVGGPMVGREPSIFEKPFAFPNKYSKVAGNPSVQYI